MPEQKRYWDANIFLSHLKNEEGKVDLCKGVLREAEDSNIKIITSTFTIAEVLYIKTKEKIPKEESQKITDFFKQEYIVTITVDREIAEKARDLVWDYNVDPDDAIHVASALRAEVDTMDTFDERLLKLDGMIGNPPLKISIPNIPYQTEMFEIEE